ncbi:chymotrypsin-like protease CTRL-1 isoform X1 [Chroicocephalus ridibundus]|uniref:chymotrypsin-like protease CTRL-1 isoform X1 n=1 Tax=Chroicocephalus ridibundus TaxID=1192867 RepID=UPI002FDDC377
MGRHGCPLPIQVRSDARLAPGAATQQGQGLGARWASPNGTAPKAGTRGTEPSPWGSIAPCPGKLLALLPPRVLAAMRPPDSCTSCSPYSHVVVLGEYDLTSNSESVQVKTVSRAITNPNWNPNTLNNDITLLKLSSPARLGARVSPVCLAPANLAVPTNLQCVTTGWGRISTSSQAMAPRLQQVVVPIISPSQCKQYWGNRITSSMLCAGGVGASSCQGDSGGPLVYQNGNVWTLIGIVSWGNSNCNIRTPAIYTRVSQFRNWIEYVVSQG